jgi:hypothetical protein
MKNAEETIGRVLAGLRDTEAYPGLERRILAAVEVRASERHAVNRRWAWSVALASVIAACLFFTIMAIQRHEHPSMQARQYALPVQPASGTQQALFLPQEPIAPTRTPFRTASHERKMQPISAEDAVLLSEMRAPSHPAPVAPLTEEEKLLLRAVHTGDPQVMAMLNPVIRAQQEAESEAEFRKFVEQSGKEDHKSDLFTE